MFSALVFASVLTAHAGPMDKVPGNTGNTGKNAQIETRTCKDGEELVLDGRGSVWNVMGSCTKVVVKGQGNVANIESLMALTVAGQGHVVNYIKNASDAPKLPTETKECTGCVVNQVDKLP